MPRRNRVTNHRRTWTGTEILSGISRLRPVRATIVIAFVLAEEGADPIGAQIGDAKLTVSREDDGV